MLSMERNEAIPFAAMKASMPFTWETFAQFMDHIERLPKAVNMMQLVPVTPLVSYVMGGWDQAKSRQPNPGGDGPDGRDHRRGDGGGRQRMGRAAPAAATPRCSATTTGP